MEFYNRTKLNKLLKLKYYEKTVHLFFIACAVMSLFSACSKTETTVIGLKAWVEHEYIDENGDGINDIAILTFRATPSEHATEHFNDISISWDGNIIHTTDSLPTECSMDLDLSADSVHTFNISCKNTHSGAAYIGTLPVIIKSGEVIISVTIDFEQSSNIEISY